ncbi:MAG: tRNA pseudouridine(55) synthase TruB [Helicobacteraceae bacterium]|jgi:tRNA pseudouridine55 synthase|nr:tRNA pseudouridine(55) synthase TruB [Helicobacteraceae bacterium]
MNRLFVAKKPLFVGSNSYLSRLKRRYGVKSAGFSGVLDPCAKGALIVAFGRYSRLFSYLAKTPKRYRATLWLGAQSPSLDIEKIARITAAPRLETASIAGVFSEFLGEIEQLPPAFSAIKIDGQRAYKLARKGEEVDIKPRKVTIYDLRLIAYNNPFLSFECTVSEGAYIRSLGRDIATKLGCEGSLSYLERLSEGRFTYDGEKPLDPLKYIDLPRNFYAKDHSELFVGKKLDISSFSVQMDGDYLIESKEFFTIVNIENGAISYKIARMDLADLSA